MDCINDTMREFERPPSKNNLSIYNIIQLFIMLYLGCDAGKECFDIFKFGSFSFVDLIKIVIDLLIFVGMLIAAYGIFIDKSDSIKTGFLLFFYGCIGLVIIWILDLIKSGFSFGSLIELLFICFITYILYKQISYI